MAGPFTPEQIAVIRAVARDEILLREREFNGWHLQAEADAYAATVEAARDTIGDAPTFRTPEGRQ